ncbi:hypothetical protein M5G22_13540 [Pseudomonas sp. TNT2022 ID233]|uniref:hypothetical protein n=1 Tax=Pseudomonas aphyarum TaxID=2942629 RepID=UPI002360AA8A|nr:hypothetical protein [Pseudomonas aphyarum]MDD1138571.1 hypothetical protein [Pseudomonas aphyarum]
MRLNHTHALVALGAALFGSQLENIAIALDQSYGEEIAAIAGAYCHAPERLRLSLREVIDVSAAPNKIRVECAADAL